MGDDRKPNQAPALSIRPGRTDRRSLLRLAAGSVITVGGAAYLVAGCEKDRAARETLRADGKPRLPPGQHLIEHLKDMGGEAGDPGLSPWKLLVHGEVRKPLTLDYRELLALPQVEQTCDVHCVTKWSCFDRSWKGVRVSDLAERAGVKDTARHVIFEAAWGYTANVPLSEATAPGVLVAHRLDGEPLPHAHGGPVRALVPDLYFWKSAKWLTGIRFVAEDAPGYWEVRGYHNHGDPWNEERYG